MKIGSKLKRGAVLCCAIMFYGCQFDAWNSEAWLESNGWDKLSPSECFSDYDYNKIKGDDFLVIRGEMKEAVVQLLNNRDSIELSDDLLGLLCEVPTGWRDADCKYILVRAVRLANSGGHYCFKTNSIITKDGDTSMSILIIFKEMSAFPGFYERDALIIKIRKDIMIDKVVLGVCVAM